jgi:hypothetical protein
MRILDVTGRLTHTRRPALPPAKGPSEAARTGRDRYTMRR